MNFRAVNDHLTCYIHSLTSPCHDMVRMALPEKFDGSAKKCKGFLRQYSIFFSLQPDVFNQGVAKCYSMLSLLTDKAL